jgi:4-hydroxyphenylpyruvate dioxygenase
MRTSIATVCLSGTIVDKLHAAADAGFDAVEIFEPDLVAAQQSPEELRALSDRLGLELALYQPFRDAEGVTEEAFRAVLHRAEAKFELMGRLGIDSVLMCSNVATATIDDDAVSASQLSRLADLAATRGMRIAYEALAWGRFVDDYRRSWRIVELADHEALGVCLDSFHILSRGHDPAGIERIPGEKIFFVQLADAPLLSMDALSWSRHHRLFPSEGGFDLPAFLANVVRAGYRGPLSLEVFNDTFRQTDAWRTARHAHRSLRVLEDATARLLAGEPAAEALSTVTAVPAPCGFDFVEIKSENTDDVAALLERLGFAFAGQHRTKTVRLWSQGGARIVLNEQQARGLEPSIAAVGLDVADAGAAASRASELRVAPAFRRTNAQDQELPAVIAPDGTEIFWSTAPPASAAPDWAAEFTGGFGDGDPAIGRIDHVNLVQRAADFDEAVLFYGSLLALRPSVTTEVAGPVGLVRSQVVRSRDGGVRFALNVAPSLSERDTTPGARPFAQHVAISCSDVVGLARRARVRGLRFLPVPANYYEDLAARFALDAERIAELRSLDLLYDRDADGEFVHFYTPTVGGVFIELVQRFGGYDGYGAANAPVRMAAQHTAG